MAHEDPTNADGKPYAAAEDSNEPIEGDVLLLAADANDLNADEGDLSERSSMSKTTEQLLSEQAGEGNEAVEVDESADDLIAREDAESNLDGFGSDADIREAGIELDNETMEDLAAQAGETSTETIDPDENLG